MKTITIYKRDGKFGKPEFLIPLDELDVIKSKETPKAYCCGIFNNPQSYVINGWIAKSMCVEIDGFIWVPTWLIKWAPITRKIIEDYYHREYVVVDFPASKEEKPAEVSYCLRKHFNTVNGADSSFGAEWRKGSHICEQRSLQDGITLFLVSCYDKYEDGYCIFACNEKGNEIKDADKGYFIEFKIIKEVQFRGNSEYASEYYNKFAGEKTFEKIQKLDDFEKLAENRYCFME